jgi:hypothetical protein
MEECDDNIPPSLQKATEQPSGNNPLHDAPVTYAHLRSAFSSNLCGRKFSTIISMELLDESMRVWMYTVAKLPYLTKYNHLYTKLMTDPQKQLVAQRQEEVAGLMLNILYEVIIRVYP